MNHISLNILDFILLVLFCVPTIIGFIRGFVKSVIPLIGIILGFVIALGFSDLLSLYLSQIFNCSAWIIHILSFIIIILIVYIITIFVGRLIYSFLSFIKLSWLDHLLGLIVGAIKGLVITAIFLYILTVFLPYNSKLITKSYLYPRIISVTKIVLPLVQQSKYKFIFKEKYLYYLNARKFNKMIKSIE